MLLPTSLVGSYPQPEWLIDRKKLAGRFPPRTRARELWRISAEFLEQEREQLGPLIFAQEYLCEFHDEAGSAFLAELIDAAFVADFPPFLPVARASA